MVPKKTLLIDFAPHSHFAGWGVRKLVKRFDSKYTFLHAARHLAQCVLFTPLRTPDIPAFSLTTFRFYHLSFTCDARRKLLRVFLNTEPLICSKIICKT